jgi:hypothetical protein
MFATAAEANTSAGAPLMICVARPELGPKLNVTLSPGWAASNCFPICVKEPCSDAAANTVIAPDDEEKDAELPEPDSAPELPELLPELHAARTPAESPAAMKLRMIRRMVSPRLGLVASGISGPSGRRGNAAGEAVGTRSFPRTGHKGRTSAGT